MNKRQLADRLGWSLSFVDVLETGKRGCNLDDLPRLARALDLDGRQVVQAYLSERHPVVYGVVFGGEVADATPQPARSQLDDLQGRIDQLPRRERSLVEALVNALHDLTTAKSAMNHEFILPRDAVIMR